MKSIPGILFAAAIVLAPAWVGADTVYGQGFSREYLFDVSLYPADLMIEYKEEIGLTKDQLTAITDLERQLQVELAVLHKAIARESAAFRRSIALDTCASDYQVAAGLDTVLALSRQESRLQITHLLRLRNLLTKEQQKTLEALWRRMLHNLRSSRPTQRSVQP